MLALELYTAAQALEYRQDMLNAARTLAARGDWQALAKKVSGAPHTNSTHYAQFETETKALMAALAAADEFHAGTGVCGAFSTIRNRIPFLSHDRALDTDVRDICELLASGVLLANE